MQGQRTGGVRLDLLLRLGEDVVQALDEFVADAGRRREDVRPRLRLRPPLGRVQRLDERRRRLDHVLGGAVDAVHELAFRCGAALGVAVYVCPHHVCVR